jgi:hypothetical protein
MRQHRKHRFVGEPEGTALTDWLNHWKTKEAGRRITQLVNELKLLKAARHVDDEQLRARMFAEAAASPSRKAVIRASDLHPSDSYRKIVLRVDRMLSRCSMRPRLFEHGRIMKFGWHYKGALAEGAHLLVTVAQMGFLDGIRTCTQPDCAKWFFAKFPNEKFCSKRCGNRHRQSSEERKEKRRAWYSENRRIRKKLNSVPKIV